MVDIGRRFNFRAKCGHPFAITPIHDRAPRMNALNKGDLMCEDLDSRDGVVGTSRFSGVWGPPRASGGLQGPPGVGTRGGSKTYLGGHV